MICTRATSDSGDMKLTVLSAGGLQRFMVCLPCLPGRPLHRLPQPHPHPHQACRAPQPLPIPPNSELCWLGFTADSQGVVRLLDQRAGAWLSLLDTRAHSKGRSDTHYIVLFFQESCFV